jgi:orotate phosphoribosyltransferase
MTEKTYQITTGDLTVKVTKGAERLADFIDVAQRKNPKRPFLFVSKVLGRHIPVKPSVMAQTYDELAEGIMANLSGPIAVVGMAETAVGLGAGVHQALLNRGCESVYLSSTRHPMDSPIFCEFKEEHSHAMAHYLHEPVDEKAQQNFIHASTLVLVDDEATTGNTFANLAKALAEAGLQDLTSLVAVTLVDWSQGALLEKLKTNEVTKQWQVHSHALIEGSWDWQAAEGIAPLALPNDVQATKKTAPILFSEKSCRAGLIESTQFKTCPTIKTGEKVLVLGSGEFVWQPYLLAKKLEDAGHDVYFSATSRSPVTDGYAMKHSLAFHDNYGENFAMYAYNIDAQIYDRILICSETSAQAWDKTLLSTLTQAEVVEYDV